MWTYFVAGEKHPPRSKTIFSWRKDSHFSLFWDLQVCVEPKTQFMNHGTGILFRAIPRDGGILFRLRRLRLRRRKRSFTADRRSVVFFLGSICVVLYCTAATIIRQIMLVPPRNTFSRPSVTLSPP